ncbi:MAG: TonB-dependent receptor [Sphingorhabdus sp.]
MLKKFSSKHCIAVSSSALIFALQASPVSAQDAPAPEEEAVVDVEQKVESTEQGNAIVVTGSRIKRSIFNSPAPIQIIDPQTEQLKGTASVGELLQSNPLAAGSNQITAAISSNFVTNGGAGAETISLRGLGAERTLVLLNGRRAGPAGTRGAVAAFDLNVLPQSIVKSVEVLKDGASSIYGSDAVAGVVNLITKTETDGILFDAFMSRPFKKGGETYQASATWGKDWGNAHFLMSFDYYKRNELKRGDRKYLDCPEEYIFTPNAAGDARSETRADLTDPRTGNYRCADTLWGHVWLYDYSYTDPSNTQTSRYNPLVTNPNSRIRRLQFSYAGDNLGTHTLPLIPPADQFQLGAPAGFFPVGYSGQSTAIENAFHPFISNSSVAPEIERVTAYVEGAINLTDNVEAYFELLHNQRESKANSFRQFWQFGFTSDSTLPSAFFGSPATGDPFAPGFTGDYLISPTAITDHFGSSQKVEYTRFMGGLRGNFGDMLPSWTWDIYGQNSDNRGRYTQQQIYQDSIDTQDFRTESCVGTTTAIRGAPCIDINWTDPQFLAGNLTQAQRDFLFGEDTGRTKYKQSSAELIVTGDLFTWFGGTVKTALGASIRRDSINDTPGHITYALIPGQDPNDPDSYTNNAWGVTASGITAGHSVTKEIFGELEIPLLKDLPFAQALTLSLAGRITNVKAVRAVDGKTAKDDGNKTYKLTGNWQVNDWLRLRSTYGTSYRAPALFEQFLADQTSFLDQRLVDPCIQWANGLADGTTSQRVADNCAADGILGNYAGGTISATIITGGGIGVLQPETSTALSASVIFTPRFGFLPDTRFNLAIDYFKIKVKGEISQLGAGPIVSGCYNSDFFPTDPLCSLFVRNKNLTPPVLTDPNAIDFVQDSFLNVNSQKNEGIDVNIGISHDFGKLGRVDFNGQMTWQLKDLVALFEGTTLDTNGEFGDPKWVGDFSISWTKDTWQFFYGLDVIGSSSNEARFIRNNGSLCNSSTIYGTYCVDLKTPAVFYHSASLTKKFKHFRITAGVSNLFDQHPPRISVVAPASGSSTFGPSLAVSQYDLYGRRGFVNLKTNF